MKPLLLYALLPLYVGSLSAQTITESQSEQFGPGTPDYNTVLTFEKYSGPLSHIVDIQVTWSLSVSDGFLIIDNDELNAVSGSYDFGAELVLDAGSTTVTLTNDLLQPIFSNAIATNSGTFNLAGNVSDGGGDFDPTGPDGISINGQPESSNGGDSVNSLFHTQYVSGFGGTAGTTFDIALDNLEFLNISTGGAIEAFLSPVTSFGNVTVTYTLVPEPSVSLLSLIGIAFLFRRRRT